MIRKKICAAVLTIALCAGMAAPAYAAANPFAQMEAQSRSAVEAAIKAGTVPPGTTIYDCMYGADENGVTIVVQYKDKNGNWIDVITQEKKENPPDALSGTSNERLSDETLAEYTAEMFRLVNEEREKAGLDPLERDAELDSAAAVRAEELSKDFSHIRPDGTRFYTVMGVEKNYNYGENGGSSGENPQDQMRGWLNSEGHRSNILDLNERGYTKIGIGVFQADNGKMYWCQLFYRPI